MNIQSEVLEDHSNVGLRLASDVPLQRRVGPAPAWGQTIWQGVWRSFEIVISVVALCCSAPVALLIALIIKLDSPGPALFWQRRVGQGGQPFWFCKFRTLYVDARERFPELYAYQFTAEEVENLHFKNEADPRVTRVGRWLRKSTLDELPNFINVLTGEMALVGPRPEIPEMVKYYLDEEKIKFTIKPGITGLAQISGRGRLKFHETARFDVAYVTSKSPWVDLKIILKTIYLIMKRDGAF